MRLFKILFTSTLFLISVFALEGYAQEIPVVETSQSYKMKGKVKRVVQKTFKAKDSSGIAVKGYRDRSYYYPTDDQILSFHDDGKLKSRAVLNLDDQIDHLYILQYDDKDRLVAIEDYFDSDESYEKGVSIPESSQRFNYNDHGNLISEIDSTSYAVQTIIYMYDDDQRLIGKEKNVVRDDFKMVSWETKVTYSNDQRKEVQTTYDWDTGGVSEEYMNIYDNSGHLILSDMGIGRENAIIPKHIYQYDENGNKIFESNIMNGDALLSNYYFEYDNNGLFKSRQYQPTENGEKYVEEYYEYDQHGNITLQRLIDYEGIESAEKLTEVKRTDYKFEYEYDDKGNWTRYILTIDDENPYGKPEIIVEREIEYY